MVGAVLEARGFGPGLATSPVALRVLKQGLLSNLEIIVEERGKCGFLGNKKGLLEHPHHVDVVPLGVVGGLAQDFWCVEIDAVVETHAQEQRNETSEPGW